jgi:hypothetical protein
MTHYASWIVWRYEQRNDKPTKVPYSPRTLMMASVTEPSHWATYAEALRLLQSGHGSFSGIGFVLSDNDPFCFIDLDNPVGDVGDVERATKVLEAFDTYTEVSPSGEGLHLILRGSVLSGRRRGKIEVYSKERYLTMTGNTYRDTTINSCDYFLQRLWEELGGANTPAPGLVAGSAQKFTDEQIYAKACETNEKFKPLWMGKYQQWYSSQSEADMALVNLLSFYSRNRDQIARMFHYSELGKRPKAHRKNYLSQMIDKSFDNLLPDISLDQLMGNLHVQIQAAKEKERKAPTPMLGEGWEMPPGLLGDIARFIYEAAPRPVQEIALAGAIGLMAGICGRSYNVSNTGLNQYVLVLATTGRGKEAAKAGISKLMKRVAANIPGANDFIGPADIASGQALVKYIGNNPCFVSILGEFGLSLQQMCAPNASTNQIQLRRVILDLFMKSGKNDTLNQTIYSDKANNTQIVQSPAFTILGETTPDSFYPHLTEEIVAQGLLPRFTCIEYSGPRGKLNEFHALAEPSEDLVATLSTLCSNAINLGINKLCIEVKADDDAKPFIHEFDKRCDNRINEAEGEVARQLWTRAHLKLMKLAALIAVGENMFEPMITEDIAKWACNLVERDIVNMLERFESGRVGRDSNEQNQIALITAKMKDYIYRPFDETLQKYQVNEAMHRDRVIQWSYLSRHLIQRPAFKDDRMGSAFALRRTLDTIIADGTLVEVNPHDIVKRYNTTGKAYFITNLNKLG